MTRLERLVLDFAENVAGETDAIWRGDAKSGNRHAKLYLRAFDALRSLGAQGREALVPLMESDRPDVRGTTAAFLLRYRTDKARAVLQELAHGKSLVAFEAGEALKRWEEGTWTLDPPDTAS
jgi:hypothetical protein